MLRTLAAGFFQSLAQLTWLPLPAFARGANPCVGAFPALGLLLGMVAAALFILGLQVLPASLALLLSLAVLLLITGATAEVAWMQTGPRAAAALILLMLLRAVALLEVAEEAVPMALLLALPLGQLAGVGALFALPAAASSAHSAGLHPTEISHRGRVVAVAFGASPLLMLTADELISVLGVFALAVSLTLFRLRRLRIAPLSGLHITALVVEVAVYLALNLAWEPPPAEGLAL